MTIEEIQEEMRALVAMMIENGVVTPTAEFSIAGLGKFRTHLRAAYDTKPFDGEYFKVVYGDTPAEVLTKARDYIAAMPTPEEAVTREYLTKVSAAIDYAHEHSIDDEYVAPLRGVTCAMTDNLLTSEGKS